MLGNIKGLGILKSLVSGKQQTGTDGSPAVAEVKELLISKEVLVREELMRTIAKKMTEKRGATSILSMDKVENETVTIFENSCQMINMVANLGYRGENRVDFGAAEKSLAIAASLYRKGVDALNDPYFAKLDEIENRAIELLKEKYGNEGENVSQRIVNAAYLVVEGVANTIKVDQETLIKITNASENLKRFVNGYLPGETVKVVF